MDFANILLVVVDSIFRFVGGGDIDLAGGGADLFIVYDLTRM